MYYNEPYLAHYGVKGMKWGVRREKAKAAVNRAKKRFYEGHGGKQFLKSELAGFGLGLASSAAAARAIKRGDARALARVSKFNKVARAGVLTADAAIVGKSIHKRANKKKQRR